MSSTRPGARAVNLVSGIRNAKWINSLLLVAVLVIGLRVGFANTPQWFDGGARLGDVLNDLSVAYSAAWIFNLLVVEVPARKDRETVIRLVLPLCTRMVGAVSGTVVEMIRQTGRTVTDPFIWPDSNTVALMCGSINPLSPANMMKWSGAGWVPMTWLERFHNTLETIDNVNSEVIPLFYRLDTALITDIHGLTDSMMRKFWPAVILTPIKNTDLSAFSTQITELILAAQRLEERRRMFERQLA